jgi:hypothetical protein
MLDVLNARVLALHEHQLRIGAVLAEARQEIAEAGDVFAEPALTLVPPKRRRPAKRHAQKKRAPASRTKAKPAPPAEGDARAGKRQVLGKSLAQLRAGSKRPGVTTRLLRTKTAGEP